MRLTMFAQPIEVARFSMKLRSPGVIRHIAFERQQELIMANGRPNFREVPVVFIEMSPDLPIREREFVCIRQGEVFEVTDDELATYAVSGCSPSGVIVHIWEITRPLDAKSKIVTA